MDALNLRPYQLQAARGVWHNLVNNKAGSCVLVAPTGSGKCLGAGTPVMRANGRIVAVENIHAGDCLAGPHGPRRVTSVTTGHEEMFRVTPVKGDSYVVNRSHILSLRMNGNAGGFKKGDIVNVTIDQYLAATDWFRHCAKGWRSDVESFQCKPIKLIIPPYILGVWLGDGTSLHPHITSADPEVISAWEGYADSIGMGVRKCDSRGTRCATFAITAGRRGNAKNKLLDDLRELKVLGNKHIPHHYKTASIADRLAILAGIIDTDGYLSSGCIDLVFKQKSLADDVCFIARSLGFSAYTNPCEKGIKSIDFTGIYHRISLSGELSRIPCKVPRRQVSPRNQIKSVTNVGIKVESIGYGDYFGFTLEGPDRLFLLGDFTVTHNTATCSFVVKQLKKNLNINTMALAHRRELVKQTASRFRNDGLSCGMIMSGELYTPSRDMQVCSVDSLDAWVSSGKIETPDVGCLVIDEAHRAMGARYQRIIEAYQERGAYILGLTATPIRSDGVGLGRSFNTMVKTPGIKWHIENNYLVPVRYKIGIVPDVKGVKLVAGDYNQAQLQAVMNQKLLIGNIVDNWRLHGENKPTMCFASGVDHSKHIVNEFLAAGIPAAHIDADTPDDVRDDVSMKLMLGTIKVVSNAAVYVEGTDIPWIGCIIMAQPTKAVAKYLQAGGRGLRTYEGKDYLIFLDHAGVVHAHGVLEMERDWELTIGKEMVEKIKSERDNAKVQFTCSVCGTLHTGAVCPSCHSKIKFTGAAKDFLPATLVDMTQADFDKLMSPKKKPKKEEITIVQKQDFYAQLLSVAAEKGRTHGWVSHTYKDKFGVWPTNMDGITPKETTVEVKRFIQHKNMAFAKSRAKEKVRA